MCRLAATYKWDLEKATKSTKKLDHEMEKARAVMKVIRKESDRQMVKQLALPKASLI